MIALASPLIAQTYERVLLPIGHDGPIGNWFASIAFYNGGSTAVPYYPQWVFCYPRPPYQCYPPHAVPPRQISSPVLPIRPEGTPVPGIFIYFPSDAIEDVTVSNRIVHGSRLDSSYLNDAGTQLPAVRANEFTDRIVLIGITLKLPFTQTLRIYEDGNRGNLQFRLRFFNASETLTERIVTTHAAPSSGMPPYGDEYPAGLQVDNLVAAFPELTLWPPAVHLEITPIEPGTRFWAFVSLTNRTTNEVSLVVPE